MQRFSELLASLGTLTGDYTRTEGMTGVTCKYCRACATRTFA